MIKKNKNNTKKHKQNKKQNKNYFFKNNSVLWT